MSFVIVIFRLKSIFSLVCSLQCFILENCLEIYPIWISFVMTFSVYFFFLLGLLLCYFFLKKSVEKSFLDSWERLIFHIPISYQSKYVLIFRSCIHLYVCLFLFYCSIFVTLLYLVEFYLLFVGTYLIFCNHFFIPIFPFVFLFLVWRCLALYRICISLHSITLCFA